MSTPNNQTTKFCKDCKYYHGGALVPTCKYTFEVSPVSGKIAWVSYRTQRGMFGNCKEVGLFFAPKEILAKNLAHRLKNQVQFICCIH